MVSALDDWAGRDPQAASEPPISRCTRRGMREKQSGTYGSKGDAGHLLSSETFHVKQGAKGLRVSVEPADVVHVHGTRRVLVLFEEEETLEAKHDRGRDYVLVPGRCEAKSILLVA